ncbi:MAG: efflux RND transporter periplasmic adaptor subunit [Gammaproteobacteria bacterium]
MRMIFTILFMACLVIAIDSNDRFLINQVYADTDQHAHDEHEDEHDDHEGENEATIHPDTAKRAGIATDQVSSKTLHKQIVLTGRVMLNRDKTYAVRARFPGIVKTVKVRWGQHVEKGQVLATVESNDSLLTYSIYAPRSGVVLERNTNVGDVANDGALFTVADLTTVWAEFHVFPRDLSQIKEQQVVNVHALETNDKAISKLDMLLPTADAASQTVIAIVPIPNESGIWRVGMIIEGYVEVGEKVADLAIKEYAIQTLNDKSVVFIKENEKTYVPREVQLGESDGDYVEVLAGIKLGEEYVTKGSYRIKADLLKSTAEHEH